MRIETKTSTRTRIISFLLCAIMMVGLLPLNAFAAYDYNSDPNIEIKPAKEMTRTGGGARQEYDSINFGTSRIYDIILSNSDGYKSIAFCVNHRWPLNGTKWQTPVPVASSGHNIANAMDEVKPFLDFYYYATHTAEGRAAFNWDWGKCEAFGAAIQSVVWLNLRPDFPPLSDAAKQQAYAEEMFAAITEKNKDKNPGDPGYIANGNDEYDMAQCMRSIATMASGNSGSVTIPADSFTYYLAIPTAGHSGDQSLLIPYYEPTSPTRDPVYVQFQKLASDTGMSLAGCTFDVYVDDIYRMTYTTTAANNQIVGPITITNDTAVVTIVETKPASGYQGNANGSVTVSSTANNTTATAAVIAGSPFSNTKFNIPLPSSGTPVLKVDADTGAPLAGAVFRFTGETTSGYDRITGTDGGVTVEMQWKNPSDDATYIPPGSYSVREIQAPDGYAIGDGRGQNADPQITFIETWYWNPGHGPNSEHDRQEDQTCVPANHGTETNTCGYYEYTSTGQLTFRNYAEKTIELLKLDESGSPLAGAKFRIYRDLVFIAERTTDTRGKIVLGDLQDGVYMFEEISAPSGYIIPQDNVRYVNVDTTDASIDPYTIIMTNYDVPEIEIEKVDINTGNIVGGAIFEVSIQGTKLPKTYTATNGRITIPRGDYDHLLLANQNSWTISVTEISAPTNYFLSDKTGQGRTQTKTMTRGTPLATFTFENAPYFGLEIAKFISGTNTLLDGAKFDVYIDGNLAFQGISGDSGTGMFNISKEKLGAYLASIGGDKWTFRVVETDAPADYVLSTPNEYTQTVHMGRSEPVYFAFGNPPTTELIIYKQNDKNEPLEGAVFEIYIDNTKAFTMTTQDDGYIRITPEEFGKYLGSGENKTTWDITVTEITPPSGYLLPTVEQRSQNQTIQKGQKTVSFSFVNTIYPVIELIKEDGDTCEPLDNALFQLDIAGKTFGTFITDKDGRIEIRYDDYVNAAGETVKGYGRFLDDLDEPNANQWQVKFTEITPPGGYLLPDNPVQENTLVLGQTLSVFSFYNWKYPDIVIQKYDSSNNQLLAGATFDVFIDGTKIPGSFITDDTGTIRISYDVYGTYLDNINKPSDKTWTVRVVETSAPANYFNAGVLTNKSQENILVLGSKLTEFVFKNEPFPDVQVYKESTKTNNPLPGVTYALKGEDNLNYFTAVTDENGIAYFENVPEGVYTLLEIDVPSGYILSEKTYIVKSAPSQSGNKQVLKYSYGNDDNPTLTIIKVDSITGERLPNVKLTVSYSPDSAPDSTIHLGDFMTDENGEIIFTTDDNLEEGNYTVYEPSPPTGYQYHKTDGDTTTFHLDGNEEYVHTIRNTPKSALIIHKIDSDTGLAVAGATFEVRYANGTSGASGNIIGTYKTSINGTITINGLEAGTYIVEEVKAAPNYELSNPSVQTAVITGNEQDVVELWFSNAKKGTLAIYKLDAVTKQPLANAQFKVTDSSGSPIGNSNGIFVTDASGVIQIDEFIKIGETITVQEIAAPDGWR